MKSNLIQENRQLFSEALHPGGGEEGVRGLPISPINNSLYPEAPPERGTFLRLSLRFIKDREITVEVNKRVEIKRALN